MGLTFGRVLRLAAASYAAIMALLMFAMIGFNLWTYHTVTSPPSPSTVSDAQTGVTLLLWLACIIFCGWSTFNREAAK